MKEQKSIPTSKVQRATKFIKTGANIGKETINTGKKVGKAVKDTVKEGK